MPEKQPKRPKRAEKRVENCQNDETDTAFGCARRPKNAGKAEKKFTEATENAKAKGWD